MSANVSFIRGKRDTIAQKWQEAPDGAIIVCTDHPRMYVKLDGKLW